MLGRFPWFDTPSGTGYLLDMIWSARKALKEDSFEDAARTAILLGHDAESTAAVACGLAGIKYGVDGIPVRWLAQIRVYGTVDLLIHRDDGHITVRVFW